MKRFFIAVILIAIVIAVVASIVACGGITPTAGGGVQKQNVTVSTLVNGMTIEQSNVADRLKLENVPGKIQHLYIFSGVSGQCILYSTVKGKVTSSGKRLTPMMGATGGQYNTPNFKVPLPNGGSVDTNEVLGDDGTYGDSVPYIYWWDVRGIYHQHYVTTGDQIVHISDEPLDVKSIIVNIEAVK
jgi:hypothetical protein